MMNGKRVAEMQGGEDRYGMQGQGNTPSVAEAPKKATAAQMAQRKIAQVKRPKGSRGNTPTALGFGGTPEPQNPFTNPSNNNSGFSFGASNQQNGAAANPFQSTPSFGFGASQNNQAQGSPAPPSSAFGANSHIQPQQASNGGSSGFSFGINTSSTPSFGGFGQSQSQQNGDKTSSSFTFGQNQNNGASNPFQFGASKPAEAPSQSSVSFGGLGQPQVNGTSSGFGFGQPKPTEPASVAHKQPTPSFSFGNTAADSDQTRRSNSPLKFGGTPQPEPQQTPNPAISTNAFTQPQQNGSSTPFSFGASKPAATPKPTTSLFNSTPQTNVEKTPFTFGNTQPNDTPKPSSSLFNIGKQDSKPAESQSEQIPKPASSLFSGFGQQNGDNSTSAAVKPASSLFSGAFGQSQPQQRPANPLSSFGGVSPQKPAEKAGDTDMTTPGSTPQKQLPAPASQSAPVSAPAATDPSVQSEKSSIEQPPTHGANLFDRVTPKSPQKNLFAAATAPKPASSLFNTSTTDFASQASEPAETPAKSSNLFGSAAQSSSTPKPPASSIFQPKALGPSSSEPTGPAAASALPPQQSHQPEVLPPSVTTTTPKVDLSSAMSSGERWKEFKELNEATLVHLTRQNPTQDWSVIMKFYLLEASKVSGKPNPLTVVQKAVVENPTGIVPSEGSSAFGSIASSMAKASANVFNAQTPKPASSHNVFSQPPATAPVSKKRAVEEDEDAVLPATEKRSKVSEPVKYPRLPENASNAAKLFESVLNKPVSQPKVTNGDKTDSQVTAKPPAFTGFKPSTNSLFATKSAESEQSVKDVPAAGGFKPTGFQPTGFAPTGGAATSFLSAFGSKAQAQATEDEKKKEMELEDKAFDDDYDSEVETEGQFRKRYREKRKKEKEEAKAKASEGAKAPSPAPPSFGGFKPAAASSEKSEAASLFKFNNPAPPTHTKSSETPANSGKSLFDRVDKPTESTPAKSTNIFGNLGTSNGTSLFSGVKTTPKTTSLFSGIGSSEDANESQQDEAGPTPKYTGLFGGKTFDPTPSTTGGQSIFASSSKPNGFHFGAHLAPPSTNASRGTTPGATTDGDVSAADVSGADEENEPSDNQKQEASQEDMSKLMPQELQENEVLLDLPIAKAMKFELGKKGDEDEKVQWMEKGKGPLYLLKSKDTGRVRILMKIAPLGRIVMNFEPVKGNEDMYKLSPNGKSLTAIFVDHLATAAKDRGKVTPWMIQVKEGKDAQEVVRLLREAQPK